MIENTNEYVKPKPEPRKYFNLTGLKYSNAVYDVRVSHKSTVAASDKWSKYSVITFRTPPKRKYNSKNYKIKIIYF